MPRVNQDIESFARIKVIGIGGSGKGALNHMIRSKLEGVEFIAMNTDTQDLHNTLAEKKLTIGKNLTRGLGAGMDPEIGKRAAEETREDIQNVIKGSDMVFITSGMGGGTGTGAAPVVASIAKQEDILTVAVVTKPFFFEGQARMRVAEKGLEELEKEVDALIVIPNDRIFQVIDQNMSFEQAFEMVDEVLKQAVEGIADLISNAGHINVDFADIRRILKDSGTALMGVGRASGENRAREAAQMAINSPLLDVSIHGAKGVLFCIYGHADLGMMEVQEAAKIITESVDDEAKIIFGISKDENLLPDEIKVTVIATGFPAVFGGSGSSSGARPANGPVYPPRATPRTDSRTDARDDHRVDPRDRTPEPLAPQVRAPQQSSAPSEAPRRAQTAYDMIRTRPEQPQERGNDRVEEQSFLRDRAPREEYAPRVESRDDRAPARPDRQFVREQEEETQDDRLVFPPREQSPAKNRAPAYESEQPERNEPTAYSAPKQQEKPRNPFGFGLGNSAKEEIVDDLDETEDWDNLPPFLKRIKK